MYVSGSTVTAEPHRGLLGGHLSHTATLLAISPLETHSA